MTTAMTITAARYSDGRPLGSRVHRETVDGPRKGLEPRGHASRTLARPRAHNGRERGLYGGAKGRYVHRPSPLCTCVRVLGEWRTGDRDVASRLRHEALWHERDARAMLLSWLAAEGLGQ